MVGRTDVHPGSVTAIALATGLIRATPVFSGTGGLPKTGQFTKVNDNSTLLMFACGSGWNGAAGAVTQAYYNIDVDIESTNGSPEGTAIYKPGSSFTFPILDTSAYTNEANSHKTHVARIAVYPSSYYGSALYRAGTYDCSITTNAGSNDSNDRFEWWVMEIPTL